MQITSNCLLGEATYSLHKAILLYSREHNSYGNSTQVCFASIHDVNVKSGAPKIEPGKAVAKNALLDALKQLAPEDYIDNELLSENILAKGNDVLVWYAKPKKRQVWFNCNEIGNVSFLADHPGLVFAVTHGNWYVFAMQGNDRPTHETPLYVAPYLNVWEGGHICVGNVDLPKGKMKFNTEAWEECFFRSYFVHPNVHTKGGLTKYRGGIFALWRSLMKGRAFPVNSLVPANETLSGMFDRVVKHGRS